MEMDFDDISVMARALVDLGCDESSVKRVLAEEFPDADVAAEYDDALLCVLALRAERAALRRREATAAVASEHDLSKSMHDVSLEGRSRRFTR